MSDAPEGPKPYQVVYSELVRNSLRELALRARELGLEARVLDAIKELDRRLRLYPQFGEPLIDLTHESGQIWRGTVPPLVVRYSILEERRLVLVTFPIVPLPGSGL